MDNILNRTSRHNKNIFTSSDFQKMKNIVRAITGTIYAIVSLTVAIALFIIFIMMMIEMIVGVIIK